MNFLNRVLTAAGAGMFLLGLGFCAKAAECESGITPTEIVENFTKNGAQVQVLSQADVDRIIDKKGAPPNGREGVPYEMILVLQNGMGAIFVAQEDCLINRIGPAPEFVIQQLFGQVSATMPYQQTLLMQGVVQYG